jgi:3D (Asp-Asp-Asp) domain-containing protein
MLRPTQLSLLAICIFTAACATRPLPPYETPLARTRIQNVRTTAYTDTESDHRPYGCHNALGSTLCSGPVNSAAADWSRWPAGTVFRIQETGETYQVDDYGWALSGTNTIDLYKPSRSAMNAWGVHRVHIEIMQWGDVWKSYHTLKPRNEYAHVRRMLKEIEDRYRRGVEPQEEPPSATPAMQVATTTTANEARWPRAQPVIPATAAPPPMQSSANGVANNPFYR